MIMVSKGTDELSDNDELKSDESSEFDCVPLDLDRALM